MTFALAGVQVFGGGVDTVVARIGLYVGKRSTVEVDVVGDPGMANGMGGQLPHFGTILIKAIKFGQFGTFGYHCLHQFAQLTDPQIGIQFSLLPAVGGRFMTDKERGLLVGGRQGR